MNNGDFNLGNDLLNQIGEALGLRSLQRVVIDIQYGHFVEIYTVFADSGKVLRAIDLEALMHGASVTQMGIDKPSEDKVG